MPPERLPARLRRGRSREPGPRSDPGRISGQDPLDHRAMHIGQAVVPPLVLESQLGVVDAQAMQDRGVQVMDVHRVLR